MIRKSREIVAKTKPFYLNFEIWEFLNLRAKANVCIRYDNTRICIRYNKYDGCCNSGFRRLRFDFYKDVFQMILIPHVCSGILHCLKFIKVLKYFKVEY